MNPQKHLDPGLIAAWAQGELDDPERSSVHSHLEHCGRCLAEADLAREHFQTPENAWLAGRSEELTTDFEARLATAAVGHRSIDPRRTPVRQPWRNRRLSWILAAAAVAFAFLGVSQFGATDRPPAPSDEFLSTSSETAHPLSIDKQLDGWVVSSGPAAESNPLRLTIQNDRGDVIYEAMSPEGSWRLRVTDIVDYGPGELYFAKVSGVGANGRPWTTDPELLP